MRNLSRREIDLRYAAADKETLVYCPTNNGYRPLFSRAKSAPLRVARRGSSIALVIAGTIVQNAHMASAVFEVRAIPEASEADGETYFVVAQTAAAAALAVQAQLGSAWIVEAIEQPISDKKAQKLGLTNGNPKLG